MTVRYSVDSEKRANSVSEPDDTVAQLPARGHLGRVNEEQFVDQVTHHEERGNKNKCGHLLTPFGKEPAIGCDARLTQHHDEVHQSGVGASRNLDAAILLDPDGAALAGENRAALAGVNRVG